jgi:hypothetical protein
LKKNIIEEIEMLARKQGIPLSRLVENIIENFLANQSGHKPKTPKEKVIYWLMTGDESIFK